MSVLILDTETTGLDFSKDRIIEIAAMVTSDDFTEVLAEYQAYLWEEDYPEITPEITKLTGITRAAQKEAGTTAPLQAIVRIQSMAVQLGCSHFIAYNADFDRQMVEAELERNGLKIGVGLPWLCAMHDLASNKDFKCWKLSHLALDKGVAVDPATLHRAMGDVELTRQMLLASKAKLQDLVEYNEVPFMVVTAMLPDFKHPTAAAKREVAKKLGFTWQQARGDERVYDKRWVKRIKQTEFEQLKTASPLPIRAV